VPETNYYVILFHRHKGDLVGTTPVKVPDYIAAIGEAQSRVQEAAGAIAFGRTGESNISAYNRIELNFPPTEEDASINTTAEEPYAVL
jgi:hypothetical protein